MLMQLNDEQILLALWILKPGVPIPFVFLEKLYQSVFLNLLYSRGLFWKHLDTKYFEKLSKESPSIFQQNLGAITICSEKIDLEELVDIFFGGYPNVTVSYVVGCLKQILM